MILIMSLPCDIRGAPLNFAPLKTRYHNRYSIINNGRDQSSSRTMNRLLVIIYLLSPNKQFTTLKGTQNYFDSTWIVLFVV